MKLVDINIFMDVFEQRAGWEASLQILSQIRQKKVKGCISALTIPILHYLRSKHFSDRKACDDVQEITKRFTIISLNKKTIALSFASSFSDFEDAIQYHSALQRKCDAIITRNGKDFSGSSIPVLTPEEYLQQKEVN